MKPVVEFASSKESGNIYFILNLVRTALRKQHKLQAYNDIFCDVTGGKCGSYKEALSRIRQDVRLVDTDGEY